jgi:hypothetical protein
MLVLTERKHKVLSAVAMRRCARASLPDRCPPDAPDPQVEIGRTWCNIEFYYMFFSSTCEVISPVLARALGISFGCLSPAR